MKPFKFASSMLTIMLTLGLPTIVLAHAGHGDEFQSTGNIQRVKINPDSDALLGITTMPVAAAAGGSSIFVPATALVEADGKKLAFVQSEKFYDPVEVTTGATKNGLIEVTQGLSVGEKLVTQGGLSLYAESRKTPAAPTGSPAATTAAPVPANNAAHDAAHASGAAHGHDDGGFPMKKYLAIAGGAVLLLGGGLTAMRVLKKNSGNSENTY
jgi:membrane fusion protein, cation efflux system